MTKMSVNKKINIPNMTVLKKAAFSDAGFLRFVAIKNVHEKLSRQYYFHDLFLKEYNKHEGNQRPDKQLRQIKKEFSGKKKKNTLWSWIFVAINVLIVLAIFLSQLNKGEIKPFSELFGQQPYYRFLFLALACFVLFIILETVKFMHLTYFATKKSNVVVSFKVAVLGKYWDSITPMGSGEQAFQIVYLSKHNYSADIASGIPLAKHLFWQVSFIFLGLVAIFIPLGSEGLTVNAVVKYGAVLGLVINIVFFTFVLLISVRKRLGARIIVSILKLLHKMKIVKNYETALTKIIRFINNYQKCIKHYMKSVKTFFIQSFLAVVTILVNLTVAYFVYLAFNFPHQTFSWFDIVGLALICEVAVSIVPLPGGSAAAEFSFLAMFSSLFTTGTAFWGLLFWRFFTYYIYIIVGLITTILDMAISKKQNKGEKLKFSNNKKEK